MWKDEIKIGKNYCFLKRLKYGAGFQQTFHQLNSSSMNFTEVSSKPKIKTL